MLMLYMVGWLTKDFEGDTFVKNSIKVKRNVGSTYDYFDIVAFKDTADECRKLKKNSKVAIEGTLQKSKFGETWYYTIVINEITLLDKPKEKEREIQETPNPVEIVEELETPQDLSNDDLPF